MHIYMNKSFVEKNLKKWNEEAISDLGEEEGKDTLIYHDETIGAIEEINYDKGTITVMAENSDFGNIYIDIKLDTENLLELIEFAVKKLNKFKSILESLK